MPQQSGASLTAYLYPKLFSTNDNVVLLQARGCQMKEIGRSFVAATLANRALNGVDQGSASADVSLFLARNLALTGQLARSYGHYGRGALGFYVRPSYDSPTTHAHLRYTHLGQRFGDNANAVGLIRDDDRRELDVGGRKTLWFAKGPAERLGLDSSGNAYWSQAGLLRGWSLRQALDVDFRSRFGLGLSWLSDYQRFEKGFHNRRLEMELGYNTREYQSLRAGLAVGRNFDSSFRLWSATARRKLGDRLASEYELQRLVLDPDPAGRSTWIHVLRANLTFHKDLLLRGFFQTNSSIERRNLQAVFVYRYRPPFGTLQLAYQRGTAEFGQRSLQGNTLFLKLSAVF
jgi:hypothetical protein